ncbi:MAG TPA: Uma2 family endonuclease [Acidobacteriaceae bacterium]
MAALFNPEELWAVREYLHTTWRPDREFVDGRIVERNWADKRHSITQRHLILVFMLKRAEWRVEVFPELRTQTAARKFRVPDVLVMKAGQHFDRYVTVPPLIAIEILSPEDRLQVMREKAADYRRFGVEHIWIIDPQARIGYQYTAAGLEQVRTSELAVSETPIRVPLDELFAELDRA